MGSPQLRIVRADDPPPLERAPIAVRLQVARRPRRDWWNSAGFGLVVVGMMFVGLVCIAIAMGWVK